MNKNLPFSIIILFVLLHACSANAQDWPEFLGAGGTARSGLTGRPVYASPILIDRKIFAVTRRAGTIVYEPGQKFTEVARNKFVGDDTDFNASPAISENKLYLRSNKALYCVSEK